MAERSQGEGDLLLIGVEGGKDTGLGCVVEVLKVSKGVGGSKDLALHRG